MLWAGCHHTLKLPHLLQEARERRALPNARDAVDAVLLASHPLDGFLCGDHTVGEVAEVGKRDLVPIPQLGVPGAGGGVLDDGHFEALLEELSEVGLDA